MSRILDALMYKAAMDGEPGEQTPEDGPDTNQKPQGVGMEPGAELPEDVRNNAHAMDPAIDDEEAIALIEQHKEELANEAMPKAAEYLDTLAEQEDAAHKFEDTINKIASWDDASVIEYFSPHVAMGRDWAMGVLGAQAKIAMEAEGGDDGVEMVAEAIAEKMADEMPDDALEDPEVQDAIAEAATAAAKDKVVEVKQAMWEEAMKEARPSVKEVGDYVASKAKGVGKHVMDNKGAYGAGGALLAAGAGVGAKKMLGKKSIRDKVMNRVRQSSRGERIGAGAGAAGVAGGGAYAANRD